MFSKVFIPYRGYYTTPFVRWQGSLQNEHPVVLAANTARRWLDTKKIDVKLFEYLVLGKTVGQLYDFYAAPWAAALMGATEIPGLLVPQACATSATAINQAAAGIEIGQYNNAFCLMADRTSNGPHTIWPTPANPGSMVTSENWTIDNFNYDPWGGMTMLETAEAVVRDAGGITKEDCDRVTLRRYEQYQDALANDREFQKRYMFSVEYKKSKKEIGLVEEDEGITLTTKEGLAKLKSVIEGGVHSFGAQTHPADGNCGLILTTKDKAQELSIDKNVEIQLLSYGFGRAPRARMAMATVPAARMALAKAGIDIKDVKSIKTHNPFVANDLYLAKETNIDVMKINNYGCSLVYGHPQAPTGGRAVIEMIEELVILGGGYGLFSGCAGGDTGAAVVVKVS